MLPLLPLLLLGTSATLVGASMLRERGQVGKDDDPNAGPLPPWRQLPDYGEGEPEVEIVGQDEQAREKDPESIRRAEDMLKLLEQDDSQTDASLPSLHEKAWKQHAERGYDDLAEWLELQALLVRGFGKLTVFFDQIRSLMEESHGDIAVMSLRKLSESDTLKEHAFRQACLEGVVTEDRETMFRSMWRMALEKLPILPATEGPGFGGVFGYDRHGVSLLSRKLPSRQERVRNVLPRHEHRQPGRERAARRQGVSDLAPEPKRREVIRQNLASATEDATPPTDEERYSLGQAEPPPARSHVEVVVDESLRRRPVKVWKR